MCEFCWLDKSDGKLWRRVWGIVLCGHKRGHIGACDHGNEWSQAHAQKKKKKVGRIEERKREG